MKRLVALAGFFMALLAARAEDLALTLLVSPGPHAAGKTTRVEIVALNPGGHDVPFHLKSSLSGTLVLGGRSWPITLDSVGAAPVAVPGGGYAVRRFDTTLPAGLAGDVILSVACEGRPPLRAVLTVAPLAEPAVATNPAESTTIPPLERLASTAPAVAALARNFSGRFLPNQPVYFLYGNADQAAKFQFSFDYRLATIASSSPTSPNVGTLRLGYTQRSVWDIDGDSSPFYDTSYMPEIAYSSDRPMPREVSKAFTWLGWRLAFQHESNGKEGLESRSMNTVYLRPRFVLGTLGKWAFIMLPEAQFYLGESSENPDIDEYRGYGKLKFYFGHNEGPTLMFSGWTGKDFDHHSYQLDLAVPLRLRWLNLESYFYVQYFNGYGESLRSYRQRSDALRAGLSLVR